MDKVKITVGDYLRRANKVYTVTKLYRKDNSITPVHSIDVEVGIVHDRIIVVMDDSGSEMYLKGFLRSGTPNEFVNNLDLSNTINMFVSKDATDLVYDGDLVAVHLGGCVRIVEYSRGLSMFDNKERILGFLTQNQRKTTYEFQWKSKDHDALVRRIRN